MCIYELCFQRNENRIILKLLRRDINILPKFLNANDFSEVEFELILKKYLC